MVGKLASIRGVYESRGDPADKLMRAEVKQVIADAMILASSEDPSGTLEKWRGDW